MAAIIRRMALSGQKREGVNAVKTGGRISKACSDAMPNTARDMSGYGYRLT